MYGQTTTTNGTMNFTFGQVYVNTPTCRKCNGAPQVTTTEGYWCAPCLEEENRKRSVGEAKKWLIAAFFAVGRKNWPRLYKQLAVVFHPDQGGDPALMIALNDVRDQFK